MNKLAGGEIIGRLAGLASRPFVGASRSSGIENRVVSGITKKVNEPIKKFLTGGRLQNALEKAHFTATFPLPGTPKLVMPIKDPMERAVDATGFGRKVVNTLSNNPELLAGLPIPAPFMNETILGTKYLLRKALGVPQGIHPALQKTAAVQPYQQSTQWTCSAACLKAVLDHYDFFVEEDDAVDAIGTMPNKGAECNQILEGARKFGFLAFEYSFDSIDQAKILLDQDIPIICDIQSFNHPGKGHYVVMVLADDELVQLMDPNTPGNWRVISRQEMDQRWWDRAMAPPHELMPKWGIVVVPQE